MNQHERKVWFCQFMASSLRRKSKILTTGDIGGKAKQSDVVKARKLMEAEALRYDLKLNPRGRTAVGPETRQPVPGGGQDNLPEKRDAAAEGHAPAAACIYKP